MEKKSVLRTMVSLFVPIFLELLLINLLSSVDTLMLSRYDPLCVNAVGTASSTLSLLTVLIIISSNGVSITVGQFLGAKKDKEASEILSQGIFFNFILGIFLFLMFYFFAGPMLKISNTNDDFFEYAKTYIQIYSIALPFQAITQVIGANFRAYGKPVYMMIVSIISNLLNVLFNWLLIFGVWIFPEMGIKGAAISTAGSLMFKTICGIILNKIILKCPVIPRRIRPDILIGIVKIGGPSALETIVYTTCAFALVAALNRLTNEEIGSRYYVNLVLGYIYMFSSALSNACGILVARHVGAHDYDTAKKLTLKTTAVGVSIIVFLVTMMNIFGRPLFMAITNYDEAYVDIIMKVLPLCYILEIGRCVNLIVIGSQKASGDVMFPLILGIISMSVVMAGGSWLFTAGFGWALVGIILAQGLDEFVRGIVSLIRWLSNGWMNHSLIKEDLKDEAELKEAE